MPRKGAAINTQPITFASLMRAALPSILMMVVTSIYVVVDGLFVSNVAGKDALAAVNIAWPVIMVMGSVGFMVGAGGSALVAKTRGEGNEKLANQFFSVLVRFAIAAGVVLGVVGALVLRPFCRAMGADGELLGQCLGYGLPLVGLLPFFILQYFFQGFCVTAGKPRLGLWTMIAAGVTNIALDAWFIAGLGWGAPGAGVATAASYVVGGALPLVYFWRPNTSYLQIAPVTLSLHESARAVSTSCLNGCSEMVGQVSASLVNMVFNYQLMRFIGADGVAAYGVIMYVETIFNAVFIGYAIGTSPLMSYEFGAKNRERQRAIFRRSLAFIGGAGLGLVLASQLMAEPLCHLFVSYDAALADLTEQAFRIYALVYLPAGLCLYASALFTSVGNGVVSAAIAFLRTLVFEAGFALVLPELLGIEGIWLAAPLANSVALTVAAGFMVALGSRYGFRRGRTLAAA